MKTQQIWNPASYDKEARFVTDLGLPVMELLDPRPGERILDLGCGDGVLTAKLAAAGCPVVGVDSSGAFVQSARERGLDARLMRAEELAFDGEFDAVFSNAVLHWIKDVDAMLAGVRRALRTGGRFVAEFGGEGCVRTIHAALYAALARRGIAPADFDLWHFRSDEVFRGHLERHGFFVEEIRLFPRPTPLPGGLRSWLEIFASHLLSALPEAQRQACMIEVEDAVRPVLCDEKGGWTADYVRLRFRAVKE